MTAILRRLAGPLLISLLAAPALAEGSITFVLDVDPPRLDPAYSTAFVERQVQHALFDKLLEVDENMNIVPALVREWTLSEDRLTYTFYLQEGVRFHDGTVLDADAVRYNLERILDPDNGSPRYSEVNVVDRVEVVDDYTVQVHLREAFTPFLGALTDRAGMIVSPTAVETLGEEGFAAAPIGSGPFRYDSRVRGDSITLVRNDDYWQEGQPLLDQVVFRVIPDENVAVTNLQSGQVHVLQTRSIPDQLVGPLTTDPRVQFEQIAGIGWQGLWLNTTQPPFDNPDLRRALDAAIDRDALVAVAYFGAAAPAWGPYSPATSYSDGQYPQPDLERAREFLAAAGHPDGFTFTLTIGTGGLYQRIGEVLQNLWDQVGIDVEIEVIEYGQVLNDLYAGLYQASLVGWSGRADPDQDIYPFHYTGGSMNYSGYSNAELDVLLDASRLQSGDERRDTILAALDIIREDVPYVYLVHASQKNAYAAGVSGIDIHPDGMIRLHHATRE